ncbi:MBL fold metallo-hydrolase [Vulgatibacter sp.]|uniref:MBL fold metallo-hydrolase n=1 Tax=Vulgatibacter sp. TaxID=1971226 RepID=UPI0035620CFF
MIFRQLFEEESSTYTYLFGCEETGTAVLLDPVMETFDRDLAAVRDLGLRLACTLETHVHADHITSGCKLRRATGSRIVVPPVQGLECADQLIEEGKPLQVGGLTFRAIFTPGHTDHHHAYLVEWGGVPRVFTGDALLIDGCGRTDFQSGDAETLWHSIHQKIFTLPDDTLVYPAHDYQHRHVSTVAQERERNPRLGGSRTREEFVGIMANLGLPYPKKMDLAVPANMKCGDCPAHVEEETHQIGGKSEQGIPAPGAPAVC